MNKIILYSSNDCDRCKRVKQMLNAHKVDYVNVDDKSVMVNKGFEQVPVLEVGDRIIEDYSLILGWLKENNYYAIMEEI